MKYLRIVHIFAATSMERHSYLINKILYISLLDVSDTVGYFK